MKRYFYNSPRGFSNENEIIFVDYDKISDIKLFEKLIESYNNSSDINWKFYRISRREAESITAGNRQLRKTYKRCGISESCNPVGCTEFTSIQEHFEYLNILDSKVYRIYCSICKSTKLERLKCSQNFRYLQRLTENIKAIQSLDIIPQ